jgi:hypothetical protein
VTLSGDETCAQAGASGPDARDAVGGFGGKGFGAGGGGGGNYVHWGPWRQRRGWRRLRRMVAGGDCRLTGFAFCVSRGDRKEIDALICQACPHRMEKDPLIPELHQK